ncbi:hypothetical protein LCGC14_2389820, partial [marine sediment metagenome]
VRLLSIDHQPVWMILHGAQAVRFDQGRPRRRGDRRLVSHDVRGRGLLERGAYCALYGLILVLRLAHLLSFAGP